MDAKILDIVESGTGSIIVRISVIDGNNEINLNNVFFNRIPCIELTIAIPTSVEDITGYIQSVITSAIQDRLSAELTKLIQNRLATKTVTLLKASLVDTVISLSKITTTGTDAQGKPANLDIAPDGTITATPIILAESSLTINPGV